MPLSRRKFNLFVFLGAVMLIVVFYVVFLFFNRGDLVVFGNVPFTFEIKGERVECTKSPCEMVLTKGRYSFLGEKLGYENEERSVVIGRGQATEVHLNFEYIPIISVIGDRMKLMIAGADYDLRNTPLVVDGMALKEEVELRPLPDSFDDFAVSSGLKYVYFDARNTDEGTDYLLDLVTKRLRRLNLGEVEAYRYAPQSDVLYFVRVEGDASYHSLNMFEPGSITPLANFTKSLKKPQIFISPDENFVAIYDSGEGELFLVNTLESSREKILTMRGVRDVKFSPQNGKLLVGNVIPGNSGLLVYSVLDIASAPSKEALKNDLSIVAQPSTIAWRDESHLVYAVPEEHAPFGDSLNNLLEVNDLDTLEISIGKKSVLVSYDVAIDAYKEVYKPDALINRVDVVSSDMVLIADGSRVWEIEFEQE